MLTEKEVETLHQIMLDYCQAKGLLHEEYIDSVYRGLENDAIKHDVGHLVRILTNYHREWISK